MKFMRGTVAVLFLAVAVAGCDDDGGTDPIVIADLAGSYDVQTFRYDEDGGGGSIDLATIPPAQGGPMGITEMTVASNGSFDGTLRLPVQGSVQEFDVGGTITLTSQTTMRIDFDAATDQLGILDDFEDGTFTLSGSLLTLVLPDVTFDFTMSGQEPVPATLTIVGTRS